MPSTLFDAFLNQVRRQPGAVALIADADRRRSRSITLTWSQLAAVTAAVAEQLQRRLAASDMLGRRIGHASDNTLTDVVLALASAALTAVEVPFDHRFDSSTIESLWKRVGGLWLDAEQCRELIEPVVRGGVPAGEPLSYLERLHSAVDVDSPALVLWTSGTTADPKGVTLSHRNLHVNAAAKLAAVPQRTGDVRLTALPLSHAYARTCDMGTWLLSGCTWAVTLGFDGWCHLAPQVMPTLANSAPSLAARLFGGDDVELGANRLRLLGCGGAAMHGQAFDDWRHRGVTVIQGYGLTETSPVICSATPDDAQPGLVGQPVDGWETDIRAGKLWVRGPHVMLGYWDDPAATAEKIDADGWLDTGDLVERDPHSGQFRILGRADDVLVLANGHKVHPIATERSVGRIPGVRHAVLITVDGQLELWIDTDRDLDPPLLGAIQAAVPPAPQGQRPRRVQKFDPPLSIAAGELTPKGTPRRQAIIDGRFEGIHAR